ncbi:NifB/NifX family molybdenum-iron cluster-binding protein [Sunxiuqinia sp. A32]|uniref:NifB/NifX family molybdenum-iron cluster-binding protein n=1 Tax=Sunxiuqinia sp. A32 TaxID=3461496 RepID=UPI004045BE2E
MIAISVTGKRKNALMDLRFGRAPYFALYDGKDITFIDNPYFEEEHDVAPRVVKLLHDKNVNKIITGEIGPKAKKSLDQHQIQTIMLNEDRISIQGIIKKIF